MNRQRKFGVLSDGRAVTEYTLRNRHGLSTGIIDYGGIVRTLLVPDKSGQFDDVVLGFDELRQYEGEHPYFGAVIGRVAGRIARGRISVGGINYQLALNDSQNHLHGGQRGFSHKLWQADYSDETQPLVLSYESASGEEGYPGRLQAQVSYRLTDDNELIVDYCATTDTQTVVNLTQHSYFNLSGDPRNTIRDHILAVNSDQVLELDDTSIPTGRILDVTNSRFDFRRPKRIAANGNGGYDNFWVLSKDLATEWAADLRHPESGRVLQIVTTAPGVQIYTGSTIPGGLVGKGQTSYGPGAGICLETQIHPDSGNHPSFPSTVINSKAAFKSRTIFRFLVAKDS